MTGIIVADAGPLIALARVQRLGLLQTLYHSVLIPPAVHDELGIRSGRPAALRLKRALDQGWLQVRPLSADAAKSLPELMRILDAGEAEAILLAEHVGCQFLLIDDRRGRRVAKRRGIPVVGVAGMLLAAKQRGLIDATLPILQELAREGYRLSPALVGEVARLAGEVPENRTPR